MFQLCQNGTLLDLQLVKLDLDKFKRGLPDLHRQRRRSVSEIVVNYLRSIQSDISTKSPRRNITKKTLLTNLWNLKLSSLVEEAVEVHVNRVPVGAVEEDVLAVTVTQAQQVAHHRHHRRGPRVRQSGHVPSLKKIR